MGSGSRTMAIFHFFLVFLPCGDYHLLFCTSSFPFTFLLLFATVSPCQPCFNMTRLVWLHVGWLLEKPQLIDVDINYYLCQMVPRAKCWESCGCCNVLFTVVGNEDE
ncbi:hypothetical protein L873DRAFT_362559 [Choiromyces venosus 120613-1]|uniref:Uncharacterized protein n=1 Tax=Choiromyces venosus 120613-1 TaxID=1336337 RepID=A0A3N4JWI5_9PEZI|nr:hypothetical protein L873DRAFT_362559 [Choiromyces venosus 120613-1]